MNNNNLIKRVTGLCTLILILFITNQIKAQNCVNVPDINGTVGISTNGVSVSFDAPGYSPLPQITLPENSTPDVIAGNSTLPVAGGFSATASNINGVSSTGGQMIHLSYTEVIIGIVRSEGEGVSTTLTGLTPGTTYIVPIEWQQITFFQSSTGESSSGGSLEVEIAGQKTLHTGIGTASTDTWQKAETSFVATGTSQEVRIRNMLDGPPTGIRTGSIVIDGGSITCSSPCTDGATAGMVTANDPDADGINNECDLDDDNDGILDTVECGELLEVQNAMSATSTTAATVGNMSQLIDGEGAGGTGAGPFPFFYWLQSQNPVQFNITMAAPSTINRVKFYAPWGSDEDIKDVQVKLYNGASLLGTEDITLPLDYATFSVPLLVSLSTTYTNVTFIEFTVLNDHNTSAVTPKRTSIIELVFLHAFCKDTDGDDIPDYLDLDSDNDGCPDALEGGDAILASNVNPNGTLDGTVDITTGVPNNVNATNGQSVGTSTDPLTLDAQGQCDSDGDGVIDANDICNGYDDSIDTDNDSVPDGCDLDNDNDGILNRDEHFPCSVTEHNFSLADALHDGALSNGVVVSGTWDEYNVAGGSLPNSASYAGAANELVSGTSINVTAGTDEALTKTIAAGNVHLTGDPTKVVGDVFVAFTELETTSVGASFTYTNVYDHLGNQLLSLADLEFFGMGYSYSSPVRDSSIYTITNPSPGTFVLTYSTAAPDVAYFRFRSKNGNFLQRFDLSVENGGADDNLSHHFRRSISCLTDTDGDGTPDYLDLDSDNDGCPDALEGGDGFNYSDLVSATDLSLGDAVATSGANRGVPTKTSDGDGQTRNTSQDASQQATECDPCDASSELFVDTDKDTIGDACDVDDDNDGILDVDETNCGSIVVAGRPTTLNGTAITAQTSVSNNDVIRIADVVSTVDGIDVDMIITIDNITSGLLYNPSTAKFSLTPFNASADDYFEVTITFVEMGTTTSVELEEFTMVGLDIDSGTDENFTELVGFSSINSNVTIGSSLTVQPYENGGGPGGYVNYGLRQDLVGTTTNWTQEGSSLDSDINHWVTATYGNASSFSFAFGVTGGTGLLTGARGFFISDMTYCAEQDTDTDGVPDRLDTDSDNDGCPDVVEGSGSILSNDSALTDLAGGSTGGSLQNLGTTSDAEGNPIYPSSGSTGYEQSITAAATDDTINACLADLSLTKTVNNAIPKLGEPITYTLTVTNNGLSNAVGVQVTDVLPAGLTYGSDNSTSTSTTYTSNVWNIGNLNANASISLQITATVTSAGVIVNTTEITQSNQTDSDSTPNNGN